MITRKEILIEACERCIKELYKYAQPKVEWEDFKEQNKNWKEGPRPYEFYYLPMNIFKEIVSNYCHAYRIPPEIKDNINTVINYLNNPTIIVYDPHKAYKHITPLKDIIGKESFKKVEDYLNKASEFFKWDSDLYSFNMTVYLGVSPSSNKETVIENWRKYRNKNIEINDLTLEEICG